MKSISVLVFFLFLLNFMTAARSQSNSGCEAFTCGNLDFTFPFFNTTMPSRCGLFMMNCSQEIPEIQLVEQGKWYKLTSVSQANTITVTDPRLNKSLVTGDCEDLSSFSLPNSPWLELSTLYKCNNTRKKNGFSFDNCRNVYYSDLEDDSGCLAIKTPESWLIPQNKNQSNVSATFSLHIDLPPGCFRCHERGGECKIISGIYRCVGLEAEEQSNHQEKIKLGVGLGLAVSTLLVVVIIVVSIKMRAKKARKSDWNDKNVEEVVMLKRYSYAKVKKMTNSFAHVLGEEDLELYTKESYLMEAKTSQ